MNPKTAPPDNNLTGRKPRQDAHNTSWHKQGGRYLAKTKTYLQGTENFVYDSNIESKVGEGGSPLA